MPKTSALRPLITVVVPTLFLSGRASAEMVEPGGITEDLATTLAARPDLGGDLEAMQYIPFSLQDDKGRIFYVGQVIHDVVRDPDTTCLSFYYKFKNAPTSSVLGVENLVAGNFCGYQTDVAILTDNPGDTAPTDALRSKDGSDVIFDFDSASSRLAPFDSSFTFLVKTNATDFEIGGRSQIHAFVTDSTEEGSQMIAGGEAWINTFRPVGPAAILSAPPPVTVSVPLPPAIWPAIPTMVGSLAYMSRLRRRPQ